MWEWAVEAIDDELGHEPLTGELEKMRWVLEKVLKEIVPRCWEMVDVGDCVP